ncbi:MAG TPA: protease pro-enzyme activation domain-containing protein [Acidobacteriaceae bacterium]|nr:protease pro-enzyme activation domain-containing protein [Acidobacteriaceae bacterium]
MRFLGRVVCAVASFLLCVAAQGAVVPQRIVTAIDPSQLSEVQGNVPHEARAATDLGAAPGNLALTEMSLRFNMTPAQENALTQLLMDQQNPSSGRYQQWLTPEQFAAQFGLAPADIQKVSNWLTSQGFSVTGVARGGTFIRFTGTVAQAQNAFHTQIHRMSVNGESHFANVTDPQLPAALASVTSLISGLHDFRLKPRVRQKITPAVTVDPLYTSAASGNHFLAPADFWTIYDEANLISGGTNGTGITVAVMGQTDVNVSDITTFRTLGGLSATAPTMYPLFTRDPGKSTNDLTEAELDLEWSGATGPGATILYVNSTDVIGGSLTQAIDFDVAPIISLSYGLCESQVGLGNLNYYNTLIQQASAQGQTVVASAGDAGATDCDSSNGSNNITVATLGLAVDWPAVLPGVTAIGGTTFNDTASPALYWSSTNSATNNSSALSYIPETVWNESIADGDLSSGGGGASAYFTKPYWQVGTGVPADSARDVPDIALQATLNHDAVLICTSDGTPQGDFCTGGTYKNASGSHDIVGGTSVGAPSFAGLMSLVVQRAGHPVGNANPTIYALANSTYYSTVFHDVITGDNKSPCTAGSTNCPAGGSIGYAAGVGYDLATGWGSLDVFNFVNHWSSVTPLTSPIGLTLSTTTLTGTPSAVVQGTNIAFTSTTTGLGAAPTGTVQFLLDNVAQGSPVAINSAGVATFSLTTTSIPNGAHTVEAAYSGDATYAGSKGFFGITITSSGTPDFSITPATSTVTIAAGGTGSVALTVNGLNSFSGSVTLTASSVTNEGSSFSANPISLLNTKTAGFTTLTISAFRTNAISGQSAKSQVPAMPWSMTGSGVALAGLLFFVLPKRRRFVGALAAVLSIGLFAASGCGGGGSTSSTPPPNNNTAPGTYTITVSGSGTSGTTTATHTATVTLIVQ